MTPEELAKLIFEISHKLTMAGCRGSLAGTTAHDRWTPWNELPDDIKTFKVAIAEELLNKYTITSLQEDDLTIS